MRSTAPTTGAAALLLPVGEEQHAVALASVREVLAVPPVAALPAGPPWLAGLVNVRGDLLPAIDTARAFGAAATAATHVAVVDTDAGPAAVLLTGTPRAAVLAERQAEGAVPGSGGQYAVGDDVATAVDLDRLLRGA